jgi:diguanylate cyclase (GGDEF)-like protein
MPTSIYDPTFEMPLVHPSNGLTAPADAPEFAALRDELALLERQADILRCRLLQLCPEQADVSAPNCAPVNELREANERLVLAALDARTVAEAVVTRLGEITRCSQRDALTGTPNRSLMLDRLESAIALSRRRGTPMAVLFVDIDHFKNINDVHGHAVGDAVLQWTAQRMEAVVRESDTVARHGGDEFVVLLAELAHAGDVRRIAGQLVAALAAPCCIGARELQITASIGVATYPQDGQDALTLIARADEAMYSAKHHGRNRFELATSTVPKPSDVDRRARAGMSGNAQHGAPAGR